MYFFRKKWNDRGSVNIREKILGNDAYIYRGDVNVARTYASNGLNQYASAGPRGFGYDMNGNLNSDAPTVGATPANSTAYVYDIENRLVSASGQATASLTYDPLRRLFSTTGGSVGVTQFLYDSISMIPLYKVCWFV